MAEHRFPRSLATIKRLRDHEPGSFVIIPPAEGETGPNAPALRYDERGDDPLGLGDTRGLLLLGATPWNGDHRPGWLVTGGVSVEPPIFRRQAPGVLVKASAEPIEMRPLDEGDPWRGSMGHLALGPFGARVIGWRPDTGARPPSPIDLETGLVDRAALEVAPTALASKWRLTLDLPTGEFSIVVDAGHQAEPSWVIHP